MNTEEIHTARLILRPVTPQQSGPITKAVNDPRVYRMVARIPPGQTKAQTLAWIATHERGRATDTDHVFAVTLDRAFIGVTGAHRAATDLPFEIGYWLVPEYWGRGFCTEATAGLIMWLERRCRVRVLVSGHFADNPASGRVLKKLGFLPCGRNRMVSAGRNEAAEHILMARLS